MQWVVQATGQAGDRAAHLVRSGAVDHLVVNHRRPKDGTEIGALSVGENQYEGVIIGRSAGQV